MQGTTGKGADPSSGDFRSFDDEGAPVRNPSWTELADTLGFEGVAYARQVHGTGILVHDAPARGQTTVPDADGHASASSGVLMAVTVADCVPVFLLDPQRRAAALLHAGWRGTAAGILEEGVSLLLDGFHGRVEDLLMHLGPAICRECYEVGPEVHQALGLPVPSEAAPVDLRGVLAERAVGMGVLSAHVTRSSFCTLCGGSPFYSHRGSDSRRQVGFLGFRPQ